MAQLVRISSCNQRVAVSVPGQDIYPRCGFNPQSGCIEEGNQLMRLSHMGVSLSPSLSEGNEKLSSGEDKPKKLMLIQRGVIQAI